MTLAATTHRTLLDSVQGPADVKALDAADLPVLAEEIRERLVTAVCRTGGHLGPNLGAVELTIALHRVFDSPRDRLVWDTGHQAYVHKMLTGRAGLFGALRQEDGLSGYPSRVESEHDLVENSHASTALSYADGMAKALSLRGDAGRVVAVVGDGALTGGMCWEALNNLGSAPHRPVVVVLNDNGRSYAPTVGGLAAHLAGLRAGAPGAATVFSALGLRYLGPVDGHDEAAVEEALRVARDLQQPAIVHCVTRKGKGYQPAEQDEADCLHGVGVIDPATGRSTAVSTPTWTSVFGDELRVLGDERSDVVAVTAAMLQPVGLLPFATRFPERVYDVGIAEQHAVTSAAGLAMGGLRPVVCVYSTFLNRAFDQVLMDVALHRLPVTFVLDRSGVTGEDGPSHHGMWDLSVLSTVPGMRVAAPRDATSLRALLHEAVAHDGPSALRFPKYKVGPDVPALRRHGRVDVLAEGEDADVLLLAVGPMAVPALAAAEALTATGLSVTVADPRWVVPVDDGVVDLASRHRLVVTVEDNGRRNGFGSLVAEALRDADCDVPLRVLGMPQEFLRHGKRDRLLAAAGLDADGIAETVLAAAYSPKRSASRR